MDALPVKVIVLQLILFLLQQLQVLIPHAMDLPGNCARRPGILFIYGRITATAVALQRLRAEHIQ